MAAHDHDDDHETAECKWHPDQEPTYRRLRVFAFDPSLATRLDTVGINEIVLAVPWEHFADRGPVGEYIEVIDYDPPSQAFYAPVDLDDRHLLAQDGTAPSEANPQFHQQMVYAVAMNTIDQFEQALGRVALWAPRIVRWKNGRFRKKVYVPRLRIYPHALREANAYYSPAKKALLFGYFSAPSSTPEMAAGSMVFTCLSHDVIAHEVTHALLDGLHPRFREATNPDVYAFHEAFSDIVAIFQRFSHGEILEDQISKTHGDLEKQNMLAQLAQQFGNAMGNRGALRDALGEVDPDTGEWRAKVADASVLAETTEPHARGSILVAAVFDAFLGIYKSRIGDLLRIATQGSGILPEGALHPDLVKRLAKEAADSAGHVLSICIRALDYCPPVDVTFGDYFRALITADFDSCPDDPRHYRVAFIDAFRRWGIYPENMRTLSEESLRWPRLSDLGGPASAAPVRMRKTDALAVPDGAIIDDMVQDVRFRHSVGEMQARFREELSRRLRLSIQEWDLHCDRERAYKLMNENAGKVKDWLTRGKGRHFSRAFADVLGLVLDKSAPRSVFRDDAGVPKVEVHSVRTSLRRGIRGSTITDLVVEITQLRRGYLDPDTQAAVDSGKTKVADAGAGDFRFRRGCTLLVNRSDFSVRYIIKTRGTIADDEELARVRRFIGRTGTSQADPFSAMTDVGQQDDEDILHLHRFG